MIYTTIFGLVLLAGGALLLIFFAKDRAQQSFAKLLMLAGLLFLVLPWFMGCSLKSQQITFAAVQAGDLVSTEVAESRGAVEANPVMQVTLPTRIGLKSLTTLATIYATHKLDQMGHKKLSKGILYALNGLMFGIIVNNWSVAQ